MRTLTMTAFCWACVTAAAAANELTPVAPPAPRPYPYKILDIQPGAIASEVIPQIEEHLGGRLSPVVMQQVVTSPTGRRFEADLTTGYETAAVSLYTRMGDEPYEAVGLGATTPVLEGRIITVKRSMRKPNDELPEPAELIAQLASLYGEPSWVKIDKYGSSVVKYVWTAEGQMPPQQDEPCWLGDYDGYAYRPERPPEEHPECQAILQMDYQAKPGQSSVWFRLIDLDLMRQDIIETDRQINEFLTETTVKPSDMKL